MAYCFIQEFQETSTKSDKIEHHGYQRFYPWFLGHLRKDNINLLEIGLHENESIKLWKNYLPKAKLFGIDINPGSVDGATVFKVDQSSAAELNNFKEQLKETEFEVIIDDGSHVPKHQLLTLQLLWEKLRPGGIYIIEDIETSYWKKSTIYGYEFNSSKPDLIGLLKQSVDRINKEFIGSDADNSNTSPFLDEIEMTSFGANCIILIKKDTAFNDYYNRDYRYKELINIRDFTVRLKRRLLRYIRRG